MDRPTPTPTELEEDITHKKDETRIEMEDIDYSRDSWKTKLWQFVKFVGPGLMVSVGYIDPGNWETDIQGGSTFGYALLYILVISNILAILLQTLAARLGLVTGRNLAQQIKNFYPSKINIVLWLLTECAIIATDLAEVLGTAIGLKLLFNIPVLWGVIITACDTLILLLLQQCGQRPLELLVLVLMFGVTICFIVELVFAQPSVVGILSGLIPTVPAGSIPVAAGMLGATIMPHNMYLHSGIISNKASRDIVMAKRLNLFAFFRFNVVS
ncbi:divalent metal cation transporter [Acrasis kona]|uniref:Divalent metal cation transporter n=1 Tax=Acrasis kona TaxID=1008807 RepID=A0AAW2YU36_9EUKA